MFPIIPSDDFELSTITALSPLDGRYREKVKDLVAIMGEYGLNYYWVIVELSETSEITNVPPFGEDTKS
ncbi:hypothetical protein KIW84_021183 [Lathyrus oleraceus]|uniref:Adenylosuccinate lyase n=1 Tax=Pisum sativum TaxID=3888 RepID=A0A9D4Y8C3_PEA|nr:hypothetical protein KIW84_021183 [Pisum sativum]